MRRTLYGRSSGPLRLAGKAAAEPAGDGAVGVWPPALPGRAARAAAPRLPRPAASTARRPTPSGCSGSPSRWSIARPFAPPPGQCAGSSAPMPASKPATRLVRMTIPPPRSKGPRVRTASAVGARRRSRPFLRGERQTSSRPLPATAMLISCRSNIWMRSSGAGFRRLA